MKEERQEKLKLSNELLDPIQDTLLDLYNFNISLFLISKVTDIVNEEVEQWCDRPLELVILSFGSMGS